MHSYSISSARWRKIGYLMIISIIVAEGVDGAIIHIFTMLPIFGPGNIPAGLPTFTIFTIIYFVWNQYLWAFPLISRFTTPPDLRGVWVGGLESSFDQTKLGEFAADGGNTSKDLPQMKINQTWTKISITIEFRNSTSQSTTASLIKEEPDPLLRITYQNRPKGHSTDKMGMHEGTNDLWYRTMKSEKILEGNYYTDEHRNNHGSVKFQRVEKDSLISL